MQMKTSFENPAKNIKNLAVGLKSFTGPASLPLFDATIYIDSWLQVLISEVFFYGNNE